MPEIKFKYSTNSKRSPSTVMPCMCRLDCLVLARAISSLQISYSSLSFWLYLPGQCQFARTKAINDITSIIVYSRLLWYIIGTTQLVHTAAWAQKGPFNTAVTVIAHPPSRWLISQFYHRHCHLKLQMIILMMISKQRKGEGLTCYLQHAQWGQIISEAAF